MGIRRFCSYAALALLLLSLTACGGGGSSSSSGGSPPALGDFTLTATAGDTSNALIWTVPALPAGAHLTGYEIKRSLDPNTPPTTIIARVGPTIAAYTDTQVVVGTTYYYKITAHSDAGNIADSHTPPPLPSPQPAPGTALPYSDSATPGGPQTAGLGDPAVCNNGPCQPPDALFQSANYALGTSPASPPSTSFTMMLKLNRPAAKADLQGVQLEGTAFNRASTPSFDAGITVPDPATPTDPNTLKFDSIKAGISIPHQYVPLTNGVFYSLTAFVANQGAVKRLEITAPATVATTGNGAYMQTIGIGPPDNRVFTFSTSYSNPSSE